MRIFFCHKAESNNAAPKCLCCYEAVTESNREFKTLRCSVPSHCPCFSVVYDVISYTVESELSENSEIPAANYDFGKDAFLNAF